jgi:toxin-antitoxin system PIN domain toxin
VKSVALLDVNFLVALFDSEHVHHDVAHEWFAEGRSSGWASCPLTENAFIRVLSNPGYGPQFTTVSELRVRLGQLRASGYHEFWPDDISFVDDHLFNVEQMRGFQQLTDVYLLGLAVWRGGRLVTFDRRVPLAAVKGAMREHLEVVSAA